MDAALKGALVQTLKIDEQRWRTCLKVTDGFDIVALVEPDKGMRII